VTTRTPPINASKQKVSSPRKSTTLLREEIAVVRQSFVSLVKDDPQSQMAPIRAMARMVSAVEAECIQRNYPSKLIREEVVNRTIGDVNLRYVVEHDERYDYRTLADDLGIALPGENIGGVVASGERYLYLRERMQVHERTLLARSIDLHMYDLAGVGNLLLREWLAEDQLSQWGLSFTPQQVLLSNGSLDGLDKTMRGLRNSRWSGPADSVAVLFPAPGFNVPEWQAKSLGLAIHRVHTSAEAGYKLTAEQLREALQHHPEIRGVYLTLSNNPTAFSYSPQELQALLATVTEYPDVLVLADMAYTGTGDIAEEQARLHAFQQSGALLQTIFCWSLSKVFTMTGDRFGYLCVGDATLAPLLGVSWVNGIAALPAEWQLRFLAFYELLRQHPQLRPKISALYTLRRAALVRQLQRINKREHLFARLNLDDGGTVYNWSQLQPDCDVFSLFARTGIAGVPGAAFGYDNDHIRFSIGIMPVPGWEDVARAESK